MLIKGDMRNRAKWKIGIVTKLITGRDGVVRGATLRTGKNLFERAVQHLYPLELNCNVREESNLNACAPRFIPKGNSKN